jgi:hypothetical protein
MTKARNEFLESYRKSLHAIASRPVDEQVSLKRKAAADKKWKELLKTANLHELAMWLEENGYRLTDYKSAIAQWYEIADQKKS